MPRVLITKGLPASGKSTWAKAQVANGDGRVVRINKDDLRAMTFPGVKHSGDQERLVVQMRDNLLMLHLKRGKDVIIDDTNLDPKHERRIREIAGAHNKVEVIFFDVDVETCVARNEQREGRHRIPEEAIRFMHKKWENDWKHIDATVSFADPEVIEFIPGLPTAVICDMDGTLAHMHNRSPYEWKKCIDDDIDETIAALLKTLADDGYFIIIVSGRDGECREETEMWLELKGVHYDHLFMRAEGDNRKDSIIKRELFDENIRGKFNIAFVLDDRNQVVDEWRQMGLKCLQVAEGNF